jgi:hypothetical protein
MIQFAVSFPEKNFILGTYLTNLRNDINILIHSDGNHEILHRHSTLNTNSSEATQ